MKEYTIDKQFHDLMHLMQEQSVDQIKTTMLQSFRKLSTTNQMILERYFDKYPYWGTLHDAISDHGFLYKKAKSLHENAESYFWLYQRLSDYRSKATFLGILENWCYFSSMNPYQEKVFDDYFDLDIVHCDQNEVFVDVGAFTGDTTLSYIKTYGIDNYKKIYCYEITPSIFTILHDNLHHFKNIECRQLGLSDTQETLFIDDSNGVLSSNRVTSTGGVTHAQLTTLDDDVSDPVSFIKMDIEGSERKALRGCRRHITEEKPKLAIAVYHDNDDLWAIPKLIHEINSDYQFYLRYNGLGLYPTETTLIAI